jgi:hypothetical protein
MNRTLLLLLALLLLTSQIVSCQPAKGANNTWSYNYIGPSADKTALGLVKTGDGGYVVLAGSTFSDRACWLLKINANGAVEWNQTIQLFNNDWLSSITSTPDGGFALAGGKDFSIVNNNIPSLNGKGIDFWLVKADKYGNIQWNQTYGGSWHESANAIANTSNGGFALAGYTWSFEPNGYWLVKTDDNGTLEWSHSYESNYGANTLIQSSDGGFSLAGTAGSQVMVVKTNENGLQQWNISLGKSLDNQARSILETTDGGYVVLGYAFTGLYEPVYSWLCKGNSTGRLERFQTFDGNYVSLTKVSSGGFVLAGSSNSSNCLIRIDALGNIQWTKPLGGTSNDSLVRSVVETSGGFVVAGSSTNFGNSSTVWVIKTDLNGNAPQDFSAPPTVASTPASSELSWLVILPVLLAVFSIAVVFRHRKNH